MQVCKYTSIQVYKYTSIQVCKYTSIQVYKYACIQVCKYTSMQVYKYASMQVYTCLYKKLNKKKEKHRWPVEKNLASEDTSGFALALSC